MELSDCDLGPEHKVYVCEEYSDRNSDSSSVLNTLITLVTGGSLKCKSFDQIGQFNLNANAKYCLSSWSEISGAALFNCCGETLTFKLTNLDNISFILSNLSLETLSKLQSSSECSSNSSSMDLWEYNSKECSCANLLVNESFFNNENAMLASITNLIYLPFDSFTNLSLTNLANLIQSSSVNALSLVNSSSSLNSIALCDLLSNSCFTNSDQTTQTNLDNLIFNSSFIANVTDAIYSFPLAFNSSTFSSSSIFLMITLRDTSATFTSGNSFLNLTNNSLGICIVILNDFVILTPCSIYVYTSNYAYKSFGRKDLSNFKLMKVSRLYSQITDNSGNYNLLCLEFSAYTIIFLCATIDRIGDNKTSCILQGCFDVSRSERREIFNNFVNTGSGFQHFENLPDHDSCSFESRLSMTDFTVCNNIFINFGSHGNFIKEVLFKYFDKDTGKIYNINKSYCIILVKKMDFYILLVKKWIFIKMREIDNE